MTLKLCAVCGEPCPDYRCKAHQLARPVKAGREERGYNAAWRNLSERARKLQPWCSTCGATEDLTCDHLEWPARTLKDVDVLCRKCNSAKGAPTPANDPRGTTPKVFPPHPGGKANILTVPTVVPRWKP